LKAGCETEQKSPHLEHEMGAFCFLNEIWLADVHKQQTRRPASLHHVAWASDLTKNRPFPDPRQ
jgi:hypothetical protein